MVVPNFPKNSHTTRFYLYCLVMNSKRLNNVTLCPSSLSTFHILIFSEETNNWNIVESIGINLQEWCLWGSLWKIPHIMATLQNTWSPLAVLIFSFDWLKLKKKKKKLKLWNDWLPDKNLLWGMLDLYWLKRYTIRATSSCSFYLDVNIFNIAHSTCQELLFNSAIYCQI